jgi:oligoendopeptidase F
MKDIGKARSIAAELRGKAVRLSQLEWTQYTTGFDFGVNRAEREYTAVLKDRRNYRTVLDLLGRDLKPLDRRRLHLLHLHLKPFHLSDRLNRLDDRIRQKTTELSKVLNGHRSTLDGRTVRSTEIARILRSSPDRGLRRRAFLARAQVNRPLVEAGFLDLVRMRREFAGLYGARDFVEYRLEMGELSPRVFDDWEGQAAGLREGYRRMASKLGARLLGDEKVMPWDTAYLAARLAPQLNSPVDLAGFYTAARELFGSLGFDLDRYNITYDIFPRRHKSEWGYNFTIEQGRDTRVLANAEGRYHEMGVLLHETGHAVHSFSTDPDDVLLNMGISGIVTEGVANLFGDLQYHRSFYRKFFGKGSARAGAAFGRLKGFQRAGAFTAMCSILFDQELYRRELRSAGDVDRLNWEVSLKILGEGPYADRAPWGFRIHHTTHPIYLHNYFLGDLTNEMLRKVFCKSRRVEDAMSRPRAFGDFIRRQVMGPSGRWPFLELFERISGEPFSLKWLKA